MIKERIEKLAEYLEEPVENFKEGYRENIVENTKTGEEYFVGNYEESREEARDQIESVFDDLGLESFTKKFQDWIMENALDNSYFDDILEEEREYFTEEEPDEEMIKMIDAYKDEPVKYIEDNFGLEEVSRIIKDAIDKGESPLDMDKIVAECIDWDGIAHFVAGYDGKELELDDDLFAYRIN